MSKDTSGTAFPLNADGTQYEGLTKREWYAGLAMQGLLSDPSSYNTFVDAAEYAFVMADAMIAEGSK